MRPTAQQEESQDDGLLACWQLDGEGGGRELGFDEAKPLIGQGKPVWLHFHLDDQGKALAEDLGRLLPAGVVEELFDPDTRPRLTSYRRGALVNLRGVNLNPGANPEDMISLRIWLSEDLILTVRRRPLMSVRELQSRLSSSEEDGPRQAGDFLAQISQALVSRMSDELDRLNDILDGYEEFDDLPEEDQRGLAGLRRAVVKLRRFLAPQNAALAQAAGLEKSWIQPSDRQALGLVVDDLQRNLEDLDLVRDRCAILKDALYVRTQDRMNKTVFHLTIITGIFLPLSFVTGLLGVNLGGVPGIEDPGAFWWLVVVLVVMGAGEFVYLKWRRFF
ncbi:MAG: CorA family divalent cation transporter [Magnetovibrionaceae bacterium]